MFEAVIGNRVQGRFTAKGAASYARETGWRWGGALLDHLDPLIAHLNDTGEATLTGDRFTLTIKRVS
jgi:hypothetical protein